MYLDPKTSLLTAAIPFAVLCSTPALAGGVDAGSIIENTATATYNDGGAQRSLDSNTVTVTVAELLNTTVTSLDSGAISVTPGETVLAYEITNTGNGPEAFVLTANPAVAGNDFDTSITSIAIDTNGNGVYDPGVDTILASPETTPVMAADETLTVFVIASVPANVADGEESDVELLVEAATGTGAPGTTFAGQGESGVDAIVGLTNGDGTATGSLIATISTVTLTKSATVADPFGGNSAVPGSVITYTITASVTGTGTVNSLTVADPFPAGTTYQAGTLTLDSVTLTDASGDDAGEANATQVSVDLGDVPSGTNHSVTFDVVIN